MDIAIILNLVFMGFYIALGVNLIRPTTRSYNLLEIKLRVLPFFFKLLGIIILVGAVFFYIKVSKGSIQRAEEMLLYQANFGLLLLIFSKEKNEDELIQHLRLKSIVVSLINTLIMVGMLFPMLFFIEELHNEWIFGFNTFLSVLLFMALINFYYTKFRMRK